MKQTSLSERLRVMRAKRGLTLSAASELLGVDRHTLRGLELGHREARYPTLAKIAKGYGVPVEELLEKPVLPGKAEVPGEEGPPEQESIPNPEGVKDLLNSPGVKDLLRFPDAGHWLATLNGLADLVEHITSND